MKRYAFTMIELIFVIVILGILAAVAIPKLSATRDDAKIASLRADIQSIKSAVPALYLSRNIASFTDAVNLDTNTWKLSNNDCVATYTDQSDDTIKLSIVQNVSSAPTKACNVKNSIDNNLSLLIEFDNSNGGSYVEALIDAFDINDTRIKLGGNRVVW